MYVQRWLCCLYGQTQNLGIWPVSGDIGDIEISDCGKWLMSRYVGSIALIQETDSFEYWAYGISQISMHP